MLFTIRRTALSTYLWLNFNLANKMVFPTISKGFRSVVREIFSGTSVPGPTSVIFRSPKQQASPSLLVMSITFDLRKIAKLLLLEM